MTRLDFIPGTLCDERMWSSSLSDLKLDDGCSGWISPTYSMIGRERRFRAFSGPWYTVSALDSKFFFPVQAIFSTFIRFRFHARATRLHSWATFCFPRIRNWRNFITCLMMPNTGSTVCFRTA